MLIFFKQRLFDSLILDEDTVVVNFLPAIVINIVWSTAPIAELKLALTGDVITTFFLLNNEFAVWTSSEAKHVLEEGDLLLVA